MAIYKAVVDINGQRETIVFDHVEAYHAVVFHYVLTELQEECPNSEIYKVECRKISKKQAQKEEINGARMWN